jgi:4'-phosphopantetheinyl transferase
MSREEKRPAIRHVTTMADADVWLVDLSVEPSSSAVEALSMDERARAGRFVFGRDRRRYLAAHVAVRNILSARTGIPAGRLEFTEGQFGKPTLANGGCSYNLSHSEDVAAVAIADAGDIGVDVEVRRSLDDAESLAMMLYTPGERRQIADAGGDSDLAFLHCWTRKEACLKAIGCGLSVEPRTFEAGAEFRRREVTITVQDREAHLAVESFHADDGLVCALARVISTVVAT